MMAQTIKATKLINNSRNETYLQRSEIAAPLCPRELGVASPEVATIKSRQKMRPERTDSNIDE